jgi:hypothetical protein
MLFHYIVSYPTQYGEKVEEFLSKSVAEMLMRDLESEGLHPLMRTILK